VIAARGSDFKPVDIGVDRFYRTNRRITCITAKKSKIPDRMREMIQVTEVRRMIWITRSGAKNPKCSQNI